MNFNLKQIVFSVYFLFFVCVCSFNLFCPENSDFLDGSEYFAELLTEFCDDNFEEGNFKSKEVIESLAKSVRKSAIDNGLISKLIEDLEKYRKLKNEYPEEAIEYISRIHFRNQSYSTNSVYDLTPLENQICNIEKTISMCCLKITEDSSKFSTSSNLDSETSPDRLKQLSDDLKNIQDNLEEYKKEVEANSDLSQDELEFTRRSAKIKRLGALIISNSLKICGNLVVGGKFCVGGVDIVALLLDIQKSINSTQCQGIDTIIDLLNTVIVNLNACCEQIQNNFITTFSLLNQILSTLTTPSIIITFGDQFNGTFTAIAELQATLTACCEQQSAASE